MRGSALGNSRLDRLLNASLWSPSLAALAAGVLFLAGVIELGTILLVCGASWLVFWIALVVLLFRFGVTTTPQIRRAIRLLLVGSLFTYAVMWGAALL